MEKGIIVMWSGAIVDIPGGFALCNGNNGTPDLRDRFIYGAGGVLDPGDTGGDTTHTHTFTTDGHTHSIPGQPPADISVALADAYFESATDSGTTNPGANMPPWYSLAFIMRV